MDYAKLATFNNFDNVAREKYLPNLDLSSPNQVKFTTYTNRVNVRNVKNSLL